MSETPNTSEAARPKERTTDRPLSGAGSTKGTIYLSWGGKVYGPSSRDEVMAGIRTAWFEHDALYWHEGLDQWKPVSEFPFSAEDAKQIAAQSVKTGEAPATPSLPAAAQEDRRPRGRSRRTRGSRPGSQRLGGKGRTIALGFALLAVLLTVGILLLLTLV
jgi:hypothetical protein